MTRWSTRPGLTAAMVLALTLALVACSGGASVTAPPTIGPSAAPPTSVPSTAIDRSATPDGPAASLAEPPAAALAAEGGDPVTGSLGTFTWADGGSDSPWLPGAPITVASGEPLTVTLAAVAPIRDWAAKRVPAGTADGVGAVAMGDGLAAPIAFVAPGPGSWSVQVSVTFGDGLGSATYYWQVAVR